MKYNVNRFNHLSANKQFSCELSDLGLNGPPPTLTLSSDMGTEATFARVGVERCGTIDDEIIAWTYKPSAESLAQCARLAGYSLTIYND